MIVVLVVVIVVIVGFSYFICVCTNANIEPIFKRKSDNSSIVYANVFQHIVLNSWNASSTFRLSH